MTVKEEALVNKELFSFKTVPFPHQVDSFKHALTQNMFLLGDEQGLGKTKQAIDIAIHKKNTQGVKHCLIVCGVNGNKFNWCKEVETHSNELAFIIGTRIGKRGKAYIGGSVKDRLEDLENLSEDDGFFIVTNLETLRNEKIQDKLFELTNNGTIGMTVIDEIHKAKNATSKQGKSIHFLNSEYKMALTGTPLMNHPIDLFNILKWLKVEELPYSAFKRRYCEMGGAYGDTIKGYKNLKELRQKLNKVQLRRTKEVLELPPKIRSIEYVEMTKQQAKIYKEVKEVIQSNIEKIQLNPNPLSQLVRLRQATAYTGILSETIKESAKLDRLLEMVKEVTSNGKKAIIYSNWTKVTDVLYEHLIEYSPALVTGEVSDREAEISNFQNNEDCKVIIGTISALGTGFTLTKASHVFFMDKPWNQANTEQAEDRAHRIGTTDTVNVTTLVCVGTIDERIEEIIEEKAILSQGVVEGDEDVIERLHVDDPDLLDRLLS